MKKTKSSFSKIAGSTIRIGLFIALLLFYSEGWAATKTWNKTTGGAWNTGANWAPNGVPAAGDDVIINSNQSAPITAVPTIALNSLKISGNVTFQSNSAKTLTIGGNVSTDFIVASGFTFTMGTNFNITLATSATANISGTLIVSNGTTFNTDGTSVETTVSGTILNQGTVTCATASKLLFTSGSTYNMASDGGLIPISTWDINSTCLITGYIASTGNPPNYITSFDQSFGNFTWNCTGQNNTSHITVGAKLTTIHGDFTMLNTGAGSFSFGNTGIGNINIAGNYIQTGGYLYCSGYGTTISNGSARNINIDGDFSLTGGTFNVSYSNVAANAVTVNVGGDFTHTAGALTETGTTTGSNITFAGPKNPQIYTSGGTVSNNVNFVVGSGATLQMGTAASPAIISGSTGSFTLQSGATLGVTSPAGISATGTNTGNIQVTGARSYSSGNINYMGNSAQTTGNGLTAAANVSISNTAGVTFTVKADIVGNISMVSTSTAFLSGFTHTAGSLTLGGAIQAGNNTYGGSSSAASIKNATYFPGIQTGIITLGACVLGTWTGTTSTDWHTGSNWCSGTVPTSSDNIIITAGVNQPIISAAAVCGNITINPGATVTLSGLNTLTVSGTLINNGSFVTNAGTLTVNGDFTNSGSYYGNTGFLVINNNTVTAFSNNGTFTANTGTVNFNGVAQTAITPAQTYFYNVIIGGTGLKTITSANFVVTGILSMENTGTISALPTYGAQAALQYNTATPRNPGVEWPATFSSAKGVIIKNTGIITLNASKTFANSPLTVFDGATLALGAFNLNNPSLVNLKCGASSAGSKITGTGLLTLGGDINVVNQLFGSAGAIIDCPVSLNTATYNFNVANDGSTAADLTLSKVISTAGSISKIGLGTLAITSAANTFTGSMIVSIGEVRMNPVSTPATFASQVNLSGGGFTTTNITAATTLTNSSTLLLSDNSNITLGSNVHSLKFADSHLISWTTAKYLKILGWTGNYTTPSSGTAGKIFVGTSATGLTAAQLAEIKFYDGTSYYNSTQLSTGEVVPSGPISVSFVSVQTGNWDDPETWGYTGSPVQGFTVPGATDNATISADHIVTLTVGSQTTTSGSLTFAANGTLAMGAYNITVGSLIANNASGIASITNSGTGTITVNGNLTTTAGGVLNLGTTQLLGTLTTITNNGTIQTKNTSSTPIPGGKTWAGILEYNATTGGQKVMAGTYNNLTLSNTSGTQTASGTISVNGTLTTTANGTLDMGTNPLFGALTSVANGGTIQTQNTSVTPIPNGKTWGGIVIYNTTSAGQSVVAGTYSTLTMGNTSGTQTAVGNLTVTTLNNNANAADVLNMGTNLLTATTINNTGTIRTQNMSASPISGGLTIGGTVNYDATSGGQTVVSATYTTLTLGNTSGTQTANGNLAVTTLNNNTNSADILNLSTYTLSASTINNSGTIRTQNTSSTPITGGLTISGTVNYDATTGGQTVVAETSYSILKLSNTSGTQTANGAIVTATLNTSAGGTFNMGTYALSGITSLSHLGILRTQNTSTTPFTGGLTWGGTVIFDGTTAQNIPSTASVFNNLAISNTAGIIALGNQTVNGILNLSVANPSETAGSLAMETYTLTLGSSETTTGIGDVTGFITRSTYTTNTSYTFGNANQIILFPVVSGQILPTSITVKISLLSAGPTWATNSIKRLYEMAQTGGSGTKALFQCNYLDTELASGFDESLLSYWSSSNNTTGAEMGRSNINIIDNWVTLSDVNMTNVPASLGSFYITLASVGNIITWNGSTSTDWNISTNWTPNGIPIATQLIIIPDASTTPNDPNLPAGAVGKAILIAGGGIVNSLTSATLTLSGIGAAWTVESGGIFNAGSSSNIIFNGTGGEASVVGSTTFNNLTISTGTTLRPAENSYTGITGALTNSGTLPAASTENTFEFKQSTAYTIPNPNGSLSGYHNLIISGAGTKTLPTPLDIYGDFMNNGSIDNNSGTLNMKALDGVPHKIGGSTTPTAFYNLAIANTTPEIEITTAVNITVSNSLTVSSNATLTPGAAYTVGGAGTLSGSGTIKVTRITSTPDFVTQYPISTKTLTNLTVDYFGTGAQTVNALDYFNLLITANGSRNVTLANSGTIGVTGLFNPDLTVTTYTVTGSTVDFKGTIAQTIPAFNFNNLTSSSSGARTLANSGTIGVAGDFTPGTNSYTVTGSTVDFNGSGAQNIGAFTFNNLTASNSGTKTAMGNLIVNAALAVTLGVTLDMTSYMLSGTSTINNSGTVKTSNTSATPIPSGLTWGGTVEYYGTAAQTVVTATYNNLTMSGTASGGGTTAGDITVNGILNLAANTSTTKGILHTGSYTLNLGILSTTTGIGDATGIVARNHVFTGLTDYSFGNQFTTLNFLNTGTKPTWIKCKITIGSTPSWQTSAIYRTYSFAQSGGTDRMIVKLHYLDNELHGTENDETKLVFWDGYDPAFAQNNFVQYYPRNKNGNDATSNWVQLTGPAINYLATSSDFDVKQWGLAYTNVTKHTWTGNGSPSYDGDWSLPGNWNGGVPTAADDVVIPLLLPGDNNGDKTPYRNLLPAYSSCAAKTLEIETGVNMTMLDNSQITITGATNAWVNNGTFNAGTAPVTFSYGIATPVVSISGAGTSNFNNLIINASTNVQLATGSFIGISGAITNSGTLDCATYANTVNYNGLNQTVFTPNGSAYSTLMLSGTGTKTLPSLLNIKANFINNGTVDANSGTVVFNGTLEQSISGSNATDFYNLSLDNSAGLLLNNNELVNNTLAFTNGLITTGNNTITVTACSTTPISGYNASSYINGKLAQVYCGAVSKVFPIGKGGNYRPLTLAYTSLTGSSTVTANQIEADIPGLIPDFITVQPSRYWTITESGGSGLAYTLTLDGSSYVAPNDPMMLQGDGSNNNAYAATFSSPNFTTAGFTSFGNFAVANCASPSITAESLATQTLCLGATISSITHTTLRGAGIGEPTGLPSGLSAVWTSNQITISGTPSVSGTFNYSIPLLGGCSAAFATGTITVSAPSTTGMTNGDYVWSGAVNTEWNSSSNWISYDGSAFGIAGSVPAISNNVLFTTFGTSCGNTDPIISSASGNCQNITIETGHEVQMSGSQILNVNGNWNNSGLFTAGGGKVVFNGTSTQTINNGSGSFNDVSFENTTAGFADINISKPMQINGIAAFNNGVVYFTGTGSLNFGTSATSNTGNINSYVNGVVSKTGIITFAFALGEDSNWGPCSIAAPANESTISAQYKHSAGSINNWNPSKMCSGSGMHHVSGVEHWLLSSNASYPAVTLYWNSSSASGIDVLADLTVAHYNGSCWENMNGTTTGDLSSGTITSTTTFTSYSPIAFGTKTPNNPLPIELASFEASCQNTAKLISWTTFTETNNHYFSLEKSLNGVDFVSVTQIKGQGNSNQIKNYRYLDNSQSEGETYYRLTQTDFDGNEVVYPMITVNCSQQQDIRIMPNPFKNTFKISGLSSNYRIEIYGSKGEKIRSINSLDSNTLEVNLEQLNDGIYFIRIFDINGTSKNFKIIKN